MTVRFGAGFHRYATLKIAESANDRNVAIPGPSAHRERPGKLQSFTATKVRLLVFANHHMWWTIDWAGGIDELHIARREYP